MKQKMFFLILINLFSINIFGQRVVHDEEKEKQIRSMEVGPWDFAPDWYYYFLHKKYSGAKKKWQWRGLKSRLVVNFDESRSAVKRIMPVRTAAVLAQMEKNKKTEEEVQKIKTLYEEELIKQADRSVDLVYSSFKDDFESMQNNIIQGLNYCMNKSKGKLYPQVKKLTTENEILCEGIAYIHKQGVGYELENSKRQKAYIEFKVKMKKLVERTANLVAIAQSHYKK